MPKLSEVFAHLEAGGHVRAAHSFDTLNLRQVLSRLEPYVEEDYYGCYTAEQDITLGALKRYCLVPAPPLNKKYTLNGITEQTLNHIREDVERVQKSDKTFTLTITEKED
jgi:hypothetical protein